MITAAEYQAWAEESLEWARIATTESSRAAYIRWAETWLELASRVQRLTALIEDRSKESTPPAAASADEGRRGRTRRISPRCRTLLRELKHFKNLILPRADQILRLGLTF